MNAARLTCAVTRGAGGGGYLKSGMQSRAKKGIFCGKHIQFGNKISEKGKNKSRRSWSPNEQRKTFYSAILDKELKINVTCHALRNIKKHGGLDRLLITRPSLINDSDFAKKLRKEMIAVLVVQAEKQGRSFELQHPAVQDYHRRAAAREAKAAIVEPFVAENAAADAAADVAAADASGLEK